MSIINVSSFIKSDRKWLLTVSGSVPVMSTIPSVTRPIKYKKRGCRSSVPPPPPPSTDSESDISSSSSAAEVSDDCISISCSDSDPLVVMPTSDLSSRLPSPTQPVASTGGITRQPSRRQLPPPTPASSPLASPAPGFQVDPLIFGWNLSYQSYLAL